MAQDFERACAADPGLANAHRLIETRDFQQARLAIQALPPSEGREVAELRWELEGGGVSPEQVMQRLVQLMRRAPQAPGARELYQLASGEAFGVRSSPSHSHPYLPRVMVNPKPESNDK